MMKLLNNSSFIVIVFVVLAYGAARNEAAMITCTGKGSPCYYKLMQCPAECPTKTPGSSKAKACFINCSSPLCQPECKGQKPNCNGVGAGCQDPRFIGADGVVFYFHGKSDEHFALVSDLNLQINARFTGLRPVGRTCDFTWIQALGILFDSHSITLEATRAATWDEEVDHLKFSYEGENISIPVGYPSQWESLDEEVIIKRTENKNSVMITVHESIEISVNVVPVTKEDDRVHSYHLPSDNCFAHLEVQFRFFGLSPKVEGVIGRTYQPDFENPAKPGVAMPVVGGEDKYRTTSLLAADCKSCVFSPVGVLERKETLMSEYGMLDCTGGATGGNGIVCRR